MNYHQAYGEWIKRSNKAAGGKPGRATREARQQLAFMKAHNLMSPSSNPGKSETDDQDHADLLLHA
jgi:hypothetical protein